MNKAPITVEQDEIMNFLQRMYVKTQGTVFSGDKTVIFVEEQTDKIDIKPIIQITTNDDKIKPRVI
jgi:hypothetical protein